VGARRGAGEAGTTRPQAQTELGGQADAELCEWLDRGVLSSFSELLMKRSRSGLVEARAVVAVAETYANAPKGGELLRNRGEAEGDIFFLIKGEVLRLVSW